LSDAHEIWAKEQYNREKVTPTRILGFTPHLILPELGDGNFLREDWFEIVSGDSPSFLAKGYNERLIRFIADLYYVEYANLSAQTMIHQLPEEPGDMNSRYLITEDPFGIGGSSRELHVLARELWIAKCNVSLENERVNFEPFWSDNTTQYRLLLENFLDAICQVADINMSSDKKNSVIDGALEYSLEH